MKKIKSFLLAFTFVFALILATVNAKAADITAVLEYQVSSDCSAIRYVGTITGIAEADLANTTVEMELSLDDQEYIKEITTVYSSVEGTKEEAENTWYVVYTLNDLLGNDGELIGSTLSAQLVVNGTVESEVKEYEISVIISKSTTYSFNSGDTTVADNYYVLKTSYEGITGEFNGLSIDASTGKLGDNAGTWFQFNDTTSLSFEVAGACTVTVKMYGDSTDYTVNGEDANSEHTYEISEAGTVTITSTANGYIGYIYIVFPVVISVDTTYSFNSGDATVADNYYVLKTSYEGITGEFNGLSIDASTGKLGDNAGTWFQFNDTTSLSFEVAGACTVTVKMYGDSTDYTVNGEDANSEHTYEISEAGTVTITSTANGYIGYIYIKF